MTFMTLKELFLVLALTIVFSRRPGGGGGGLKAKAGLGLPEAGAA
jgi:hypothetical protein